MPTVDQRYDEAIELQQQGKLEEAVGSLSALIAEHPDYALGHAALSVFYGKLGRHDEAIEHAKKGLRARARRLLQLHGDESDLSACRPAPRGRGGPRHRDGETVGRATRAIDQSILWPNRRGQLADVQLLLLALRTVQRVVVGEVPL